MGANKRCCHFCIHYQPSKNNGKKMSYSICRATGKNKSLIYRLLFFKKKLQKGIDYFKA